MFPISNDCSLVIAIMALEEKLNLADLLGMDRVSRQNVSALLIPLLFTLSSPLFDQLERWLGALLRRVNHHEESIQKLATAALSSVRIDDLAR